MSTRYSYYYGCGYYSCTDYYYNNTYSNNCYSPNVAPVANNDCFTGCEDKPVVISVSSLLSNDTDKNGDKLTITGVQGALNGTVSLANGYVTFTPIANYNGPASFTYTISDGKGGTSTATVNLTLSPVNDIPDAVNDNITVTDPGVVTIDPATLLANDKDVDGDKLAIVSVQCATNGTVALVNGKVVFTPNAGYSGPATFTYTISDGKGGCGTASSDTATVCLTIPKANVGPDAVNDGTIVGDEDKAFVINMATLLANDTDANSDKLTITSVQAATHGLVAMNAVTGQVTFTPDANYNGPASFTYTISDGKGGVDTATVYLNICAVNDAPDAVNDSYTATSTEPFVIAQTALLANDTDIEANTLSILSVQNPSNGTVSLVGSNVVFTPTAGFSGTATFTYTVTDGKGGTDTATVSVYVPAHVVDAVEDGVIELAQNSPINILASSLLANDTDSEGHALTVISVQNGLNGQVSLLNGVITFTPDAGYSGPATFTYTISDGTTAAAPAINISLNFDSLLQGQDVALVDGWTTSNLGGKVEVRSGSVYGTNSTSNVIELERNTGDAGNLIKEFSAAKGQLVTLSFDYAARSGATAGSDSAVQVIVNGTVLKTINTQSTSFAMQTVQFEADGGLVRLEFKALDSNSLGGLLDNILITAPAITGNLGLTDTATVTLNVLAPANTAPVAVDDNLGGKENIALVIASSTLLGNDTDPESNTLTVTEVNGGVNGLVSLDKATGQVTFTPTPNYSGSASFTYTISDGNGGFDTATVNLNIEPSSSLANIISVSEEGLPGGSLDALGIVDTTNDAAASGVLSFANPNGNISLTLTAPASSLTAGGETVTWQGDGTQTLTAMVAGKQIATLSINDLGEYTFKLLAPVDHSGANVEDVLTLDFGVSLSDGNLIVNKTLSVNIEDDMPSVQSKNQDVAMIDTNLLITLDVSGSMSQASGIGSQTRLESAVQSVSNLIDTYDGFGNVRVRLVTFSSNAQAVGDKWLTVDEVKAELANLAPTGQTNYDAALGATITAYDATGKLDNAQVLSYVFSDGDPNRGLGDETALVGTVNNLEADKGIQANEEATWKNFLTLNQIKAFSIGMGTDIFTPQTLDPMAYDGQAQQDINAVVVTSFANLDQVLAETVTNSNTTGLLDLGSDTGFLNSITVEGVTYSYDKQNNTIASSGGVNASVFNDLSSELTVSLASGAKYVINVESGAYEYQLPVSLTSTITETFDYVASDVDGDKVNASNTLVVSKTNVTSGTTAADELFGTNTPDLIYGREGDDTITGGGSIDRLIAGDGNDSITGGAGNDSMSGGLGADTFIWALADAGVQGASANDTITDFDVASSALGGDVLDLRDLLVGENHTSGIGNLADFLHFEKAGTDTIVHISSTGEFATGFNAANDVQTIALLNVDLLAGLSNDQAVIQDLLSKNKLSVD